MHALSRREERRRPSNAPAAGLLGPCVCARSCASGATRASRSSGRTTETLTGRASRAGMPDGGMRQGRAGGRRGTAYRDQQRRTASRTRARGREGGREGGERETEWDHESDPGAKTRGRTGSGPRTGGHHSGPPPIQPGRDSDGEGRRRFPPAPPDSPRRYPILSPGGVRVARAWWGGAAAGWGIPAITADPHNPRDSDGEDLRCSPHPRLTLRGGITAGPSRPEGGRRGARGARAGLPAL